MAGEKEIKAVVLDRLLKKGEIDEFSLVFSEMTLAGKIRRVDLGYVNGQEMVAIEIKSEKDSLQRLSGQIEEYRKYFDRVVVVAATKFVEGVVSATEEDVAVWEFSGGGVKPVRRGRKIKGIEKVSYVELMTKREVSLLARKAGVRAGDLAMFELKSEVVGKIRGVSKKDVKDVLLDGIYKRFGLASKRFLKRVCKEGEVAVADVPLLSPYLTV